VPEGMVEGHCLVYYSYKDVEKLEKFMSGKPVRTGNRVCFIAGSSSLTPKLQCQGENFTPLFLEEFDSNR
jgi:hypothetical protein